MNICIFVIKPCGDFKIIICRLDEQEWLSKTYSKKLQIIYLQRDEIKMPLSILVKCIYKIFSNYCNVICKQQIISEILEFIISKFWIIINLRIWAFDIVLWLILDLEDRIDWKRKM